MSSVQRPNSEEVEQLLRNAQLRDELEPYLDEAVMSLNLAHPHTSACIPGPQSPRRAMMLGSGEY